MPESCSDALASSESKHFLPPLYLHYKEGINKGGTNSSSCSIDVLPCEILLRCLTWGDWGDLAKLACVQMSWRDLLQDSAHYGGAEAQWQLAQALLKGTNGLQRNSKLAIKYLIDLSGGSASDGYPNHPTNDAKNCQKLTSIFPPAMRMLAHCYFTGEGVEMDKKKGLAWLESAAVQGADIDASHELAVIYEVGNYGVDVDVVEAAKWFRYAAERGHVEAMAEYAMSCELGCGVEQSDAEALEWYVKAANAGHAEASFSVGEAYEEAKGVPQSDEEACLWYYKAAVMGDDDSKRALQRLSDIARIVVPGLGAILNE